MLECSLRFIPKGLLYSVQWEITFKITKSKGDNSQGTYEISPLPIFSRSGCPARTGNIDLQAGVYIFPRNHFFYPPPPLRNHFFSPIKSKGFYTPNFTNNYFQLFWHHSSFLFLNYYVFIQFSLNFSPFFPIFIYFFQFFPPFFLLFCYRSFLPFIFFLQHNLRSIFFTPPRGGVKRKNIHPCQPVSFMHGGKVEHFQVDSRKIFTNGIFVH